jgi:hypothetical protein
VRSGGGGGARLGSAPPRGEAVPRGSRPNVGNPPVGQAVARTGRPPVPGGGDQYYWPSYYYGGWNYRSPYWGYGYYNNYWGGLYMYNPFWWGYGDPYYGWDPYLGGGWANIYPGYYTGGYAAPDQAELPDGALKLKVKPREAEVYVDGYFVGQVDSFDGPFQHVDLEPGTHRVEIRAEGFEPITFEVKIAPKQSVTYKGELKRIQ